MRPVGLLLVGKGPPDTGGIAAMLTQLHERLRRDDRVELLNLTRDREYVAGTLSMTNVARTVTDLWRVLRAAGRSEVVDIHTAFVPAVTVIRAGLLALAARARGSRVILHVHGGDFPRWISGGSRGWLVNACLVAVDQVVAVSSEVMQAIPTDKVALIPNGVDTELFRPPTGRDPDSRMVMFVGLLTERKGAIDLIEASTLLDERGVSHELVLVGGRPDEGGDAEMAVRRAARGTERFLGAVPHGEIARLLRTADVFCLPSWYEAMPLSILEAMASGLPVVATVVGQIPDMVDADTGILVPPRDPDALADALHRLLVDDRLRLRLGINARERVSRDYSLEGSIQRLRDLVASLRAPPLI